MYAMAIAANISSILIGEYHGWNHLYLYKQKRW
jgi:LytS/YehU family sensor histidine kinase